MKIYLFTLFLSSLVLVGCNRPNSNPETLDPIYSALNADKKGLEQGLAEEKKRLAEFEEALTKVLPQTGQIKYAIKRINETKGKIEKIQQQILYVELRTEKRLIEDRVAYIKAFNKGEAWPDPKEYEEFLSQKKLESAQRTWSPRGRIEESGKPAKKATSSEHASEH